MILVKNILSFLKKKGWTLKEVTDTHYLLKPPTRLKFEPDTLFHLVKETYSGTRYYDENMKVITESIADIYELDYDALEVLFSKSPTEIKKINKVSAALLSAAN